MLSLFQKIVWDVGKEYAKNDQRCENNEAPRN